ncbi:hypothetical protein [Salirhabdus salicampi]|uniref:hypothetical protein n=1 Tax=Salirhabdus salicampi TaxID=476102 RepID=UPI0020C4D570|nr:hypothetical protein [Salirhabdus salicampi]MCP8615281.1 hypothetical protein [Salirhabdus salicampi]
MRKVGLIFFIMMFAAILSACSDVTNQTNEVIDLVNQGDFQQAKEKIEQYRKDDSISEDELYEILSNVNEESLKNINELVEQFEQGDIDVDGFEKKLAGYDSLQIGNLFSKLSTVEDETEDLVESRKSFASAVEYFEQSKYKEAITMFQKTKKSDVKYRDAQQYIEDSRSELLEQIKTEIAVLAEQGNYYGAYRYVTSYDQYFNGDEAYSALIAEQKSAYFDATVKKVANLRNDNEYRVAIEELELLHSTIGMDNEVRELISKVETEQQNYYKKQRDEILANMNREYDEMDDLTSVTPKGIEPRTLHLPRGSFTFYPVVQFYGNQPGKGQSAISIVAGFSQDDWIFMDEIIFNVDGERFTWGISYGERDTDIDGGYIYEWIFRTHAYQYDILDQLEKIANAESVSIRFNGDTSLRDETLTKKQINQVKNALTLYYMIQE